LQWDRLGLAADERDRADQALDSDGGAQRQEDGDLGDAGGDSGQQPQRAVDQERLRADGGEVPQRVAEVDA
jgi:hypothetical protein